MSIVCTKLLTITQGLMRNACSTQSQPKAAKYQVWRQSLCKVNSSPGSPCLLYTKIQLQYC